jgi:cytochrome c2
LLQESRSAKVDEALIGRFRQLVVGEDNRLAAAGMLQGKADFRGLDAAAQKMAAAPGGGEQTTEARQDLKAAMNGFISEAKRREDALTTKKKFVAADFTAAVSQRGIAVGGGKPIEAIEQRAEELSAQIAEIDASLSAAIDYRRGLESIFQEIDMPEAEVLKQIYAIETDMNRLHENIHMESFRFGEWVNRWPVLDALYNGNIKLDQLWLPDMTIDYNFSHVARYDRCINCHRAIDKTAPGSAVDPAFPAIPRDERIRMVQLPTPDSPPEPEKTTEGEEVAPTLASVYGLILAPTGQIDPDKVTVQVALPESLSAIGGLETGDIIEEINGGKIHTAANVNFYLLEGALWGHPIEIKIRRGLDQPFTSHPRLDLFVGGSSPHKKGEMGCTICHDGQGSATEFKWASHTPNSPEQALEWSRKYGWFDNHHWSFPMTPERFIESNCLKCHHEVVELEPGERFPEPPAPKLVEGYQLVREYGCYGCHEINGYDGPDKRIGPDLRVEPDYYDVAAQVLMDEGLSDEDRGWATTLVHRPENDELRQQLYRAIQQDIEKARSADTSEQARLSSVTHALVDLLKNAETPGSFRKVGPSLRHLESKVNYDWLYAWIRRPADFRPSTRMPQFFGQHDHLNVDRKEITITDEEGKKQQITDAEYTRRFEDIETLALADYLLAISQPFAYLDPPPGVTEPPSAERGKWLFESRGCLACHSHKDFPGIHSSQGPDLSRVAAKFNTDKGQRWLYSWLKSPHRYHARTVMPDLFLDPIAETNTAGQPTGRVTDPADDITAFLLSVPTDWQPTDVPSQVLSAKDKAALQDLTAVWLSASFPKKRAEVYARDGIPESMASRVKADEKLLVLAAKPTDPAQQQAFVRQQLQYVARKSIGRYGCFGCHNIPGFEGAKPIGTPLADWGRKDTSQLAFENIGQFLATHGVAEDGSEAPADGAAHDHVNPMEHDPETGYFLQALNSHQRQGFLWQKLRMPRSFDYEATRNKRYDERLRMPKFPFDAQQREAVMTFVLGLTNEAPAAKYIYKPDARQEAIVQGRHVLDKYNCAGCHVLDMERWDIAFEPDWFEDPPTTDDYPFLAPVVTTDQIEDSLQIDRQGLLHANLHGMPTLNEETGKPNLVDEDGVPLEPDDTESDPYYEFTLYEHAVVAGATRLVGVQNLMVAAKRGGFGPAQGVSYPGKGGDLAKYLFSRVIAEEHKTNPQAKGSEAWGWLPPPLMDEGEKVQTDWLHDFLMDPTAIRPAVVMRMPNFRMSGDEATKLVDYFAAKGNADFPYEYNVRRRGGYLAELEQAHPSFLNDAMNIVTDGNYCVKCHSVGDFQPGGDIRTLGPDLSDVYRRLRPDFVRRWVANPVRVLPYTGMPVNIPYNPAPPLFGGVSQDLFPGPSVAQLDGLVDLLMNFDEYALRHTSVKGLVKEPTVPVEASAGATAPPSTESAIRVGRPAEATGGQSGE